MNFKISNNFLYKILFAFILLLNITWRYFFRIETSNIKEKSNIIRSLVFSSFWLINSIKLNPCQKLLFLLGQNYTSCPYTCLTVYIPGRFSNQVITFLRAIKICQMSGIKKLVLPPHFLSFSNRKAFSNFYYEDIQVIFSTNISECIQADVYFRPKRMPRLEFENSFNIHFKDMFYKALPQVEIPNNSLVIHIRSGDIFFNKDPSYGQPPCNFYLDIIKMKNWSKVFLIAEDNVNPCVDIVKQYAIYKQQSWENDLAYLLNAENFVASQGTIWIAVTLLSKKLKNLYTFNRPESQIPDHMNCVPSNSVKRFMEEWKFSEKQVEALKHLKCLRWEHVTHRPLLSTDPHVFQKVI